MIEIVDVSHEYRPGVPVLTHVSLTVSPGEIVALIGPNGSGKSTLVRMLNALIVPREGRVSVDGRDTSDPESTRSIRTSVGMVFQHPDEQIVATSVMDDVAFGPENLGLSREDIRARVDDSLRATGLVGLEHREPHLLSGGQKQRLVLAGALAMNPHYLVLDEPASMLDPVGRREFLEVVHLRRDQGCGIILVTHDAAQAASADRIAVLSGGHLVLDAPVAEALSHAEDFTAWGLEVPGLLRLTEALRTEGLEVPNGTLTPRRLVEAL